LKPKPEEEQEWSLVKCFVVCNLFTQKDAPDPDSQFLSPLSVPLNSYHLMPSRCVVLCFSRAAEQGHPDGQGTDDGAVSTAGPG